MKNILALFLVLLVFSTGSVYAEIITSTFSHIEEGYVELKYDSEQVDEKILDRYLVLHPFRRNNSRYMLAINHQSPRYKIKSKYTPGGGWTENKEWKDEVHRIKLALAYENLFFLYSLNEIEELEELVNYYKESLEFDIWINERAVSFSKTQDINDLKLKYKTYDFSESIKNIIKKIEEEESFDVKMKLVSYEWYNTVNRNFRSRLDDNRRDIWDKYKKKYSIKENWIEHYID